MGAEGYVETDQYERGRRAGYNDAMKQMRNHVADLQGRADQLQADLAALERRRIREVHEASERGREYAALIGAIRSTEAGDDRG